MSLWWIVALAVVSLVCAGIYAWNKVKNIPLPLTGNLPILPPGPKLPIPTSTGIPLICPACGHLIDSTGHCRCPALDMALMDEKMKKARLKPAKTKQYRSIDDDWNSN